MDQVHRVGTQVRCAFPVLPAHTHDPDVSTGDIVSVTVLGQPVVILNRLEDALALFEKRSANYSDRPTMLVAGEMIGWDQSLVLSQYGERFRDIRRLLHQYIGTEKLMHKFHGIEEAEARRFARRLLRDPSAWVKHTKRCVACFAFGRIYAVAHGAAGLQAQSYSRWPSAISSRRNETSCLRS